MANACNDAEPSRIWCVGMHCVNGSTRMGCCCPQFPRSCACHQQCFDKFCGEQSGRGVVGSPERACARFYPRQVKCFQWVGDSGHTAAAQLSVIPTLQVSKGRGGALGAQRHMLASQISVWLPVSAQCGCTASECREPGS